MHLEDGEDFGYPVLQLYPRFLQGLHKLGNKLLQATEERREVKVGTDKYVMNSTQAETIIGMLIDGANKGNIDLSDPCNVLYSLNKEKVIQTLAKTDTEMVKSTRGKCSADGMCSKCVCEFINAAVSYTQEMLVQSVMGSASQADVLCPDDLSVGMSIESLVEEYIDPWIQNTGCQGISEDINQNEDICDVADLDFGPESNYENNTVLCTTIHVCGKTTIANKDLKIVTENIFIGLGSEIEQEAPLKAANGNDSTTESESGTDGAPGAVGKTLQFQQRVFF